MAWNWTSASWRSAAGVGDRFYNKKTSAQFDQIETAILQYHPIGPASLRLRALQDVLTAVRDWWVWKQEDKHDFTSTETKIGGTNTKIAGKSQDVKKWWRTSFSKRETAIDLLVRSVVEEIDDILADERMRWGNAVFTDPNDHDNHRGDYRYLITSQTETPLNPTPYREATVNNPDLISNAVISASVISHDNVHVWAPSGFILKAPKKCIGAAFKDDIATANAVAFGHQLERYREMLRLYLGKKNDENIGLPRPSDITPEVGKHNEVMVLGKTYDKQTSVAGIFVIVDAESDTIAGIEPATCYKILATFVKAGKPKQLVEPMPMVTPGRMQKYRNLNAQRGLPIVQIPVGNHVEVPGSTLNGLHASGVRHPFVDDAMVLHGSNGHLELERDVVAKRATKTINDETHGHTGNGKCRLCGEGS